ncbi:hypothetical protein DCO48_19370 [Pseudomonas sp. SDI]|uniref:hypothetical protein n=1 Tax=Pseudomonas sp. SDI TaxID=2170734 RepID=UPI000DE70CF3|nr:hypothetical protein [Pseudomonas sp. SDI]PWB30714.1 hypothetical protein DCO48_19370 [Pseudomonas sp. SDI]
MGSRYAEMGERLPGRNGKWVTPDDVEAIHSINNLQIDGINQAGIVQKAKQVRFAGVPDWKR